MAQRLTQAAQTGQAQALTAHAESIPALIKTLDPEQDGKITATINGQEAQKAQGRDLTEPVEAPSTPTILLDTPSSQAWLSDASIASYAGQDLARVAQGDQHETAAHTHATVAGQTLSLYTHAGGITAHAANGPVSLRAHTDELQILADKDVTILSVNGEIHINAQSKIELIGADSGIILDGGDITFVTPGTWAAKGAAQAMMAGASASAASVSLPESAPAETMAAVNEVAALEITTELDEGSANDGTGATLRKAMVYGKTYEFKVKDFESKAPVSPSSIQWKAFGHSPEGTRFDLRLKPSGLSATLTLEELELCGTDITVQAYIQSQGSGASLSVPVHCRFRWFDGQRVKTQAAQRVAEPWRIDQGQSSLCGMAALFYLMAQNKPGPYQKLATELHRKGQLKLGDYMVKPHFAAEDTMYELKPTEQRFTELKMSEVDWIVLAVSRSSESLLAFDGLGTGGTDQFKSVNWPGLMAELTQAIGGFEQVESVDTSMLGVVVKKSVFGQIYDAFSDSDIASLLEIDKLYQSGKKVMLMIDANMLNGGTKYSIGDISRSHWIVYEGNLKMFDRDGKFTTVSSETVTVSFSAYSYGTNPNTSEKYLDNTDSKYLSESMNNFRKNGISAKSWKSTYYGYIAAI
ncbi:DUF2345 domain-containing protein [Ideonella paludis]|uniref:DUF2345 domain-containing protein n=1 Tax=Ideonella paludis TaxID=1233411 RepID=UPI0036387AFE